MSAILKVFQDAGLLQELGTVNGVYQDNYGQPLDGQETIKQRWVKNTGDVDAPAVVVTETQDTRGYILYSVDQQNWSNNAVLGDMAVGATKTFYIKIAIPLGASEAYGVGAFYKISNF